MARGHRYLTVVMDLERGAVVFVGDGKGADALKTVLEAAAAQRGPDRGGGHGHVGGVSVGGVDPPAQAPPIAFDHFHVVKLFNEKPLGPPPALYREATEVQHKEVLKGDAVAACCRRTPRTWTRRRT